jgi:hypothetical protein
MYQSHIEVSTISISVATVRKVQPKQSQEPYAGVDKDLVIWEVTGGGVWLIYIFWTIEYKCWHQQDRDWAVVVSRRNQQLPMRFDRPNIPKSTIIGHIRSTMQTMLRNFEQV